MNNEERDNINLASLCIRLYEDINEHYAEKRWRLNLAPKKKAFETNVIVSNDVYRALCIVLCDLSETFFNRDGKLILSTFQTGIMIRGLETTEKELNDLCIIEDNKMIIQKSRLGIALAFLNEKRINIKPIYKKNGIDISFLLQQNN